MPPRPRPCRRWLEQSRHAAFQKLHQLIALPHRDGNRRGDRVCDRCAPDALSPGISDHVRALRLPGHAGLHPAGRAAGDSARRPESRRCSARLLCRDLGRVHRRAHHVVPVRSSGGERQDRKDCETEDGGEKKRGPHLDNVGNLMKPEELKEKILNPRAYMAEGFEKEYNKKLMPDKYKELMADQDIDQLVAYLSSLKDSSVETPKPVKK